MTRHAVERILTQLVDLAVSVNGHVAAARLGRGPATYPESFRLAAEAGLLDAQLADQLAPSSGLRNATCSPTNTWRLTYSSWHKALSAR